MLTRFRRPHGATLNVAALALAGLAAGMGAAPAAAEDAPPAVIYDLGGKFDKSFNESAYDGVQRLKKEGIAALEFEIGSEAQREQALRRFAKRGADPVVVVGFTQASALAKVAPEFPKTRFTIIDGQVDAPNVQSLTFKEHEGAFLAGLLAAQTSKTGKVGFIGGMDIPLIRRFQCAYEQGAQHTEPKAAVVSNMTGTTPAAWSDPTRGAELARSQFTAGADIIFAAAGGTGLGVYQAAKEAKRLAIGVDSNQNGLHPGTMLSSMLKRVDVAVYTTVMDARAGRWKPGANVLGLKEQGVGLAMDSHNAALVSQQTRRRLSQAEAAVATGKLKVVDYTVANACKH
jgi:basic membrane protein A